jgi:hypothetical protein
MSIGVCQPITQARFQGASRPGAKHGCSRPQTHRAHELLPHHSTDVRFDALSAYG